jgi:hypothetical protein
LVHCSCGGSDGPSIVAAEDDGSSQSEAAGASLAIAEEAGGLVSSWNGCNSAGTDAPCLPAE